MAEDWTVEGQGQGHDIAASGALQDVWRVNFRTVPEGVSGYVDIPLKTYLADPLGSVSSRVQPLVDAIKQTQAL